MLINATEEFVCVGAWGSMEEALGAQCRAAPAVALLDFGLPGMSGLRGFPRSASTTRNCIRRADRVRGERARHRSPLRRRDGIFAEEHPALPAAGRSA